MAELQVSTCASRVLFGSLGAADVLNLVVERLECGIYLSIMLTEVSRGLVGSHVPKRIWTLVSLTQASKGRHVNARAGGTRRSRGSGVSWRSLKKQNQELYSFISLYLMSCSLLVDYSFLISLVKLIPKNVGMKCPICSAVCSLLSLSCLGHSYNANKLK